MMKKIMFLCFFCLLCFQGFTQTDKYTEKLRKLYSAEEYYKVIDYKGGKDSEMASLSLYIKGMACFQLRKYSRAIGYFDDAIEKGEPLAEMYYFKGLCHLILEHYDESVASLNNAYEMEPDESSYSEFLGMAYFYHEKYDSAIVWFEISLNLEDDNGSVYTMLGDSHLKLKQYDKAAIAFQSAYENSAKFKDKKYAHYNIAESQYLAGHFDLAKETLNQHLVEFKNDFDAISLLIQVHHALKETEAVKPLIDKMNEGKKNDRAFPNALRNRYCIDRFSVGPNEVKAYQSFQDQSYHVYPWKHQFTVFDADGKELYMIETQLDSNAGNENTYTLCKVQGDSLFKYENVLYDENFDYLQFREIVQKIISGEVQATELMTGYKAWYSKKKKAKTGGAGDSFETAIIVGSIPEEYAYLRENYPGSTFIMQALVMHDGVPYDILSIKTADGEEMEIYFNISSFFGKY